MRRGILLPASSKTLYQPVTQVKSTGTAGNIRAGRTLAVADFTTIGLPTPRALWNLSNVNDSSGNAVTLTNGGGVTFVHGIEGVATTAAQFSGQATGFLSAPHSIGQAFGSWGCWFKAVKRLGDQGIMTMSKTNTSDSLFEFGISPSNQLYVRVSPLNNMTTTYFTTVGYGAMVADDTWHFGGFTWDGNVARLYLDGRLVGMSTEVSAGAPVGGPLLLTGTSLLYLGSRQMDTAMTFGGVMDEAFVTDAIITEDQWRFLYAAKIAHGVANPRLVEINHQRNNRTAILASGDFPSQPLVGYNFLTGQLTTDNYGSLGKTLTNNNTVTEGPSADGTTGSAVFLLSGSQTLSANDSSLPSGAGARTIGFLVGRKRAAISQGILGWGTLVAAQEVLVHHDGVGRLEMCSVAVDSAAVGPWDHASGNQVWCFAVYDPADPTTLKHRLYYDGVLQSSAVATTLNTVLAGANRFRIGSRTDATLFGTQTLGNVFITNYAMRSNEMRAIVDKPGAVVGARRPLDPNKHIVRIDDGFLYCIFDQLPGRDSVELVIEGL